MPMEEKANPNCRGNSGERGTATSSQSLGAALRCTSSHDTYAVYRSHIPVRVSRVVSAGIQRPSQQSVVTHDQAHSLPVAASLGNQDPALSLPHTEENNSSTPLPGPEKNEKDLSVISQTEPSHILKTRSLVGCHASQETYVKYRSYITQNNPHK